MKHNLKSIKQYSAKIKEEATFILEKTNLLNTLSKFGKVNIIGSYDLNLMYDPDVDIVVACENPRKSSLSALKVLAGEGMFQRYEYGDFFNFKFKNRPEGYILCLQLLYEGKRWEIETWFLKSSKKQEEVTNEVKNKLTPELADKILELKYRRNKEGSTKYDLSSVEIYKSVIRDLKI